MPRKMIHPSWYALTDYFTAVIAWTVFYFLRKQILGQDYTTDSTFWLGVFFIPLGWILLYALVGSYNSIYKKSRLTEFTKSFVCTAIGSIVLFFLFILDDVRNDYNYYYSAFGLLFGIHFILNLAGRILVLNRAKAQMARKSVQFKALIVGHYDNALRIYREAEKRLEVEGFAAVGFVSLSDAERTAYKFLPRLGPVHKLESIIDEHQIELVVLAIDKSDQKLIEDLINRLSEKNVAIKIQANTLDILSGSVKTSNVLGAVLIDLHTGLMPEWQQNIKRVIDIAAAFLSLVFLSPLFIYIAIRVAFSSRGPIFYLQ
jgi:FlaA1/EpsC-like NDP-sugar epimerase